MEENIGALAKLHIENDMLTRQTEFCGAGVTIGLFFVSYSRPNKFSNKPQYYDISSKFGHLKMSYK